MSSFAAKQVVPLPIVLSKTINSILDFIKNGNYYSYELITYLVKESGIDKSDYKNVLNAITFYSNELIIKDVSF